ncbi:MAG: TonB-dependent receptor [Alphaproteobacteria bacterium GM7ARS4]|nr:TonB-dependent receptor [Alphaproteobacteria bacterium GM7ARS4]
MSFEKKQSVRWRRSIGVVAAMTLLCLPISRTGHAETTELPTIHVHAPTPLHHSGMVVDDVPHNVHIVQPDTYNSNDLAAMIHSQLGSLTIHDVQNNPYQKDVSLRGYIASPLLGSPQGIAFYQNGSRFNDVFGDVIQWDTLPTFAIESVQVIPGANPVFGLNAIGGAISVNMKNAFSQPHHQIALSGGSFAQSNNVVEVRHVSFDKTWGSYLGGTYFREDGWRDFSSSRVGQIYGDVTKKTDKLTWSLNVSASDSELVGNGPTPEDLLAVEGRDAIYTHPDRTENENILFATQASYIMDSKWTFRGNAHVRLRERSTLNGDEFEAEECDVGGDEFFVTDEDAVDADGDCLDEDGNKASDIDDVEDAIILSTGDALEEDDLPDGLDDDDIAALNTSTTESSDISLTGQAHYDDIFYGRPFSAIFGVNYHYGQVEYHSQTTLGMFDATRGVSSLALLVGGETPVDLETTQHHVGTYFTSSYELLSALTLTVDGRYNRTTIELENTGGAHNNDLNGDHVYSRYNPGASLLWRVSPLFQLYGRYGEGNRTPTASELACADPEQPCRLPNAFLADPPLEHVVNRSYELGMRGRYTDASVTWQWHTSLFSGHNHNDILFVAGNAIGTGYFTNAGRTRRQGIEFGVQGTTKSLRYALNYAFVDAEYRTDEVLPSGEAYENLDDALCDDDGCYVKKGNAIPGIPRHNIKGGITLFVDNVSFGVEGIYTARQYLRGDDVNAFDPIPSAVVFNLKAGYQLFDNLDVHLDVYNLLDEEYETFGIIAEPELDAGGRSPRFLGPGAPRTFLGRVNYRF